MPNKNRERQVIAAVACPACGAPAGKLCQVRKESRAGARRPIVHSARRRLWQQAILPHTYFAILDFDNGSRSQVCLFIVRRRFRCERLYLQPEGSSCSVKIKTTAVGSAPRIWNDTPISGNLLVAGILGGVVLQAGEKVEVEAVAAPGFMGRIVIGFFGWENEKPNEREK